MCSTASSLMDFRQISHGLGGLTRMPSIMPNFPSEPGLFRFVVAGQLLMDLGVILMFLSMRGEMFGQLEVIVGRFYGNGRVW